MAVTKYDRGSAIVIEAEIKEYTPFLGYEYESTTTPPVITVTDKTGKKVVNAQNMEQSTTGKYFYVVQSEATWAPGQYTAKVSASIVPDRDITAKKSIFILE